MFASDFIADYLLPLNRLDLLENTIPSTQPVMGAAFHRVITNECLGSDSRILKGFLLKCSGCKASLPLEKLLQAKPISFLEMKSYKTLWTRWGSAAA